MSGQVYPSVTAGRISQIALATVNELSIVIKEQAICLRNQASSISISTSFSRPDFLGNGSVLSSGAGSRRGFEEGLSASLADVPRSSRFKMVLIINFTRIYPASSFVANLHISM